jgi:hypothetical protein
MLSGGTDMDRKFGAGWALVLLVLACGSNAQPTSPSNAPTTDAGPAGPFDITIASSPPIDLPGTVLWLDADFGVAREGAQVRAWTDRSGHGHVLEREATTDPGPTADRLAGHGALRFGGHARMVLAADIEEQARAALTLGDQDFLIALVLRKEGGAADPIFFALAPQALGAAAGPPMALLSLQPALQFTLDAGGSRSTVATTAGLDGGPRLLVVTGQGPRLTVRIDGQQVGDRPFGRLTGERMDGTMVSLPFLAPFVGAWDFDLPGWSGLIGDVVVVAGPGIGDAIAPLEDYLKKKYGL